MGKGYAYFDKYGILHITKSEKTAQKFAEGKVVATNVPFSGGYPVNEEGKSIIIYNFGIGPAYVGGNRGGGTEVEVEELTFLDELLDALT